MADDFLKNLSKLAEVFGLAQSKQGNQARAAALAAVLKGIANFPYEKYKEAGIWVPRNQFYDVFAPIGAERQLYKLCASDYIFFLGKRGKLYAYGIHGSARRAMFRLVKPRDLTTRELQLLAEGFRGISAH